MKASDLIAALSSIPGDTEVDILIDEEDHARGEGIYEVYIIPDASDGKQFLNLGKRPTWDLTRVEA